MAIIVTIRETAGSKIGIKIGADSLEDALKEALSTYKELKEIERIEYPEVAAEGKVLPPKASDARRRTKRGRPNLLAENEIFSSATTRKSKATRAKKITAAERARIDRLNKLLKDETVHFEKHVVNGKILSLDKNCSFCKAYYDQLSKRRQTISS
jgi:hypothetical protein